MKLVIFDALNSLRLGNYLSYAEISDEYRLIGCPEINVVVDYLVSNHLIQPILSEEQSVKFWELSTKGINEWYLAAYWWNDKPWWKRALMRITLVDLE